MKVIQEKTNLGTDTIFEEEDKFIRFSFGGNLDLYWSIYNKNKNVNTNNGVVSNYFIITKENYGVYRLFEKLFDDIENINIFDEQYIPFYIEYEENKKEYIEEKRKNIEEEKNRYRLLNYSNYNELFNPDNRTITWYSDETAHEVANFLKIKQEEDIFKLEFYTQPYIEGYDKDFHSDDYISIRFRNSGSSYAPFNSIFMRMYNNMSEIDDINDIGHQIHIEEYLHEKKKKLVKKKWFNYKIFELIDFL